MDDFPYRWRSWPEKIYKCGGQAVDHTINLVRVLQAECAFTAAFEGCVL